MGWPAGGDRRPARYSIVIVKYWKTVRAEVQIMKVISSSSDKTLLYS